MVHDTTRIALDAIAEHHPGQYIAWLTLWGALFVFTVRALAYDLFGEPPIKDDELKRFRTWERINADIARRKAPKTEPVDAP